MPNSLSNMSISFIGDSGVGKTTMRKALAGESLSAVEEQATAYVNETKYSINDDYFLTLFLCEPHDMPNILNALYKACDTSVICIVIDAADSPQKQCETIFRYKQLIKENTDDEFRHKVIVVANKKNDVANILTKEELSSCSIDAVDYSIGSAKQFAESCEAERADFKELACLAYVFIAEVTRAYRRVKDISHENISIPAASSLSANPLADSTRLSRDTNSASSTVAPSASLFRRPVSPERSATAAASVSTPSDAPRQPVR